MTQFKHRKSTDQIFEFFRIPIQRICFTRSTTYNSIKMIVAFRRISLSRLYYRDITNLLDEPTHDYVTLSATKLFFE